MDYLYLYFLGWALWALLVLIVSIRGAKSFYNKSSGAEVAAFSFVYFGVLLGCIWFAAILVIFLYSVVSYFIKKAIGG